MINNEFSIYRETFEIGCSASTDKYIYGEKNNEVPSYAIYPTFRTNDSNATGFL